MGLVHHFFENGLHLKMKKVFLYCLRVNKEQESLIEQRSFKYFSENGYFYRFSCKVSKTVFSLNYESLLTSLVFHVSVFNRFLTLIPHIGFKIMLVGIIVCRGVLFSSTLAKRLHHYKLFKIFHNFQTYPLYLSDCLTHLQDFVLFYVQS